MKAILAALALVTLIATPTFAQSAPSALGSRPTSPRRAPISVITGTENFGQRSGEAFWFEAHAMACSMMRPALVPAA